MSMSPQSRQRLGRALVLFSVLAVVATAGAGTAAADPGKQPTPTSEDEWRIMLPQVPLPSSQCATASYPSLEWQVAECTTPPDVPMVPKAPGTPWEPQVVGNGWDLSALSPGGPISTALGSFFDVNVVSESSPIANTGPGVANAYTLQLNTNRFATPACMGSPNNGPGPMGCKGWQQFLFANNGGSVHRGFIQYWLIRYNAACPGGWTQFMFSGSADIYCVRNAPMAVSLPPEPITNLANLRVAGGVTTDADAIVVFDGLSAYGAPGINAVNTAGRWLVAEFNVFGYGGNSNGGSMASFNAGASLSVRTSISYGGTAAPLCVAQGFTSETNNLGFASPPSAMPSSPALLFREDTAGSSVPDCTTQGTTVGEPHLRTFGGTQYDFQATGDFLLAEADPEFVVQARHIPSVPIWPDAAFNSAVSTLMGPARVSVCASVTAPLFVNGTPTVVADGSAIYVDGVSIRRSQSTYTIVDENGNSVRATINDGTWIDVGVGLGQWPTNVRGLLANFDNSPYLLQGANGQGYPVPLDFNQRYQEHGNGWRVAPGDSLLGDCGPLVAEGNPQQPFSVDDLDDQIRADARNACLEAGVKETAPTVLDACTLDVAVLGKSAAAVHVGLTEPIVNGG
jgi:hypothetical protein